MPNANAQAIDRLIISLGLDPEDVSKALDKVDNEIQGTFNKMPETVNNALAQVDAGFNNVFGGIMRNFIAPLASALAVRSMFGNYLKGADALGKTADRLGVNGEELHAWSEAAARAGGSAESFQGSVQQLSRGIEEYKSLGGGRSQKVLEAMGFTKSDFDVAKGGTADVFDVLTKLSDKAETMDKMQFNAFASKLGLDQGTITLLQQGSKGLEEAIARQKELGTYTKRDMEITGRFNDTIADMKQTFQAASAIVLRMVVPVLTKVAETLTKVINFMRKHEPFVIAFFTGIAIVLTSTLIPAIKKVGLSMSAWVKKNPKLMALIGVVLALALIIDDLVTYIRGGESALEGLWKKFGTGEEVGAKLAKVLVFLQKIGPWILAAGAAWKATRLLTAFGGLSKILFTIGNTIPILTLRLFAMAAAQKVIAGLKAAFAAFNAVVIANPIGLVIAAAIVAIVLMIKHWDKVTQAVNVVVDSIKAAWAAFFGWIFDKIEWVSEKWGKVKGFFGFGGKDGKDGQPSPAQAASSAIAPSMSGMAEASVKPSAVTNNSKVQNSSETHIGQITVNTQATDADGVAKGVGDALQERQNNAQMVNLVNSGTNTK